MRIRKLHMFFFAVLICSVAFSKAQAQQAYGYASIDIDQSTNTGTGYAMTELDYETAAYYNAVVEAHIEDGNGNVITSGSNEAYQTATVILGFGDILQCITYRIISYLILDAVIFDDCGYIDLFGFGYLGFDTWWGWGDFWNDRWLCRWERFIRIAQIIETVTECITAHVTCAPSSTRVLPSFDLRGTALRQNIERRFITGADPAVTSGNSMTITCSAMDDFGQPVSNVLITFSFNTAAHTLDDGGHQNHAGVRPRGILNPTSVRTDGSGNAQTTFSSPPFSGTTDIDVKANGSLVYSTTVTTVMPGLQQLFSGGNYRLFGENDYHPSNHWGTAGAVTGVQQIADDYRNQIYPDGFPAPPPGTPIDPVDLPTDYYKLHYNDMSLRLGGKFDIRPVPPTWNVNRHHDEHRVGINCDVRERNVPNDIVTINGAQRQRWAVLEDIFRAAGSTRTRHETNPRHWHLRFEFGAQAAELEILSPYNGTPATVPGQIQAEEYDIGDYGNAYFLPPPADPNTDDASDIETYDASDGSTALMSVSGQWTAYTVNIVSSDTYTLNARVASAYTGSIFHVEVDGVNKTGPVYIPNTGSSDNYQIVSVNNIPLDAGQHVMTIVVDASGGNVDYLSWSVYQPCNPTYSQLSKCWQLGGDWDYDICRCVYY